MPRKNSGWAGSTAISRTAFATQTFLSPDEPAAAGWTGDLFAGPTDPHKASNGSPTRLAPAPMFHPTSVRCEAGDAAMKPLQRFFSPACAGGFKLPLAAVMAGDR